MNLQAAYTLTAMGAIMLAVLIIGTACYLP